MNLIIVLLVVLLSTGLVYYIGNYVDEVNKKELLNKCASELIRDFRHGFGYEINIHNEHILELHDRCLNE